MNDHDQELAGAFDSQAPQFEIAPVQSDPAALARLIREADLPPGGLVLDAGCGPGLVSAALLAAGFRVVGVDLSREMIERARKRCAPFGTRASFSQVSVFDPAVDTLRYYLPDRAKPAQRDAQLPRHLPCSRVAGRIIARSGADRQPAGA